MLKTLVLMTVLAGGLGAAEWKYYCFGFLNAHPERQEIPQAEAMEIQKGHLAHMGKMAAEGKLLVAGPFMTAGKARGIVIYNCASLAEAQGYTKPDPAVVNQRLEMEFYRMHAVEGMGEPLASKMKADPAYKYEMVQLPMFVVYKTEKTGAMPAAVGKAHYEQSQRLVEEGKLRFFGRFEDGGEKLGVYVFGKMAEAEAKALMEEDPMVKGGYARVEGLVWYVADEAVPGKR